MIRVIRIRDQICKGNDDFAFYNTVNDSFVKINGFVVWGGLKEFESDLSEDSNLTEETKIRILSVARSVIPSLREYEPVDDD